VRVIISSVYIGMENVMETVTCSSLVVRMLPRQLSSYEVISSRVY
jgi:hypothetical protein